MSVETCGVCRGKKEVMRLGMMTGPCKACDAKGYIVLSAKAETKPIIKKKAKPKYPLLKEDKVNGEDPEPQAA